MKKYFLNFFSVVSAFVLCWLLLGCDAGEVNKNTVASDSSSSPAIKRDTTMPDEPLKASVAATDSVTFNVRNSTKDSIGSKISIHHGKVKIIDTTKRDK